MIIREEHQSSPAPNLDSAIEERQSLLRVLEKKGEELQSQVKEFNQQLNAVQAELATLLNARRIIYKQRIEAGIGETSPLASLAALIERRSGGLSKITNIPFEMARVLGETRATQDQSTTIVNNVLAILSASEHSLSPTEIQQKLLREGGRDVSINVLTGILSRLNKDERVFRAGRGRYTISPVGAILETVIDDHAEQREGNGSAGDAQVPA